MKDNFTNGCLGQLDNRLVLTLVGPNCNFPQKSLMAIFKIYWGL